MVKPRASTAIACMLCGRIINREADMPRHLKTHAENKGDQMYHCTYPGCTHQTLQKSNLRAHENIHSGERPHKCPTQGCRFSSSHPGSLTRHRKEQHGYQPKGNSESNPPASTRRTTRRRRRSSPYPSSSVLLADDYVEKGSKNTSAAYSTELIVKHPQVNHTHVAPTPCTDHAPLVSGSAVLTASEAPIAEHPHLLVPEKWDLHTFDAAAQTVSDDVFTNFNSLFNDWIPQVAPVNSGPCLPFPLVQHTVDDATVPTHPSIFFPTLCNMEDPPLTTTHPPPVVSYTIDSVQMPASSFSPSYEPQHSVDNLPAPTSAPWALSAYEALYAPSGYEYDGYTTTAAFSEAQFDLSQSDSFATPDMDMGVGYPQPQLDAVYPRALVDVDQSYLGGSYFYAPTTCDDPSTSRDLGMQGLYA